MARSSRARRDAARPSEQSSATGEAAPDVIAQLERERDALRSELAAAEARIAALEQQRTELLNRIDWAIDSLHSLVERQG
jgi:predicted  nucleic acid-binding Zn-ribbon protein